MLSLKSTRAHSVLSSSDDSFSDVCVSSGLGCPSLSTHRLLLAAVSPLLSSVLGDTVVPYHECRLILPGVDQQTLRDLIQFLHAEEIQLSGEDDYCSLLELMQLLDIDYVNKCNVDCSGGGTTEDQDVFEEEDCDYINEDYQCDIENNETTASAAREQQFTVKSEYFESVHESASGNQATAIVSSNTTGAELMHACQYCEKCFSSTQHLNKHVKFRHKLGGLRCSQCEFSTSNKHSLLRHVSAVHDSASGPQIPQMTHFKCSICWKKFVTKSSVDRHTKMVHLRVKSFKCSLCEAAFAMNYDLDKHMRTHTGEKPFCCDFCGKSFTQSSSLSTHKATHIRPGLS